MIPSASEPDQCLNGSYNVSIFFYHFIFQLPRSRGFAKPHVFHRGRLLLQHRARLSIHGSAAYGAVRRRVGHHALPDDQRDRRAHRHQAQAHRHSCGCRRPAPAKVRAQGDPDDRRADGGTGRMHPGRLHHHHGHRQLPWA